MTKAECAGNADEFLAKSLFVNRFFEGELWLCLQFAGKPAKDHELEYCHSIYLGLNNI